MTTPEVRAAGGVVWRRRDAAVEVLLVHRPRYDDWTFPKGKTDEGESDEACALREVLEETGLTCELGLEVATLRYLDGRDRPKVVRYWAMRVLAAADRPSDDEVDEQVWLEVDTARSRLTYDHDRVVLDTAARLVS